MTPRRDTSLPKNRTKIPGDALDLIRQSFFEEYKELLGEKDLVLEGEMYLEELIVRLGLKERGALRQFNFECSVNFPAGKEQAMEHIYLAVDVISSMLEQYLEAEGDIEFPQDWTEFQLENKSVWLKASTENSELEAQADALLGTEFLNEQKEIDEAFVDELFAKIRAGEFDSDLKH